MRYFPTHLNIETSDACTRRCRWCPPQRRRAPGPPRLLDRALLRKLLLELQSAPAPLKISLNWSDEPLVHPHFFSLARLCRSLLPGATWLLQTNGDLLDAAAVRRLARLFDAVTINLYSRAAHDRLLALGLDLPEAVPGGALLHAGRLPPRSGQAAFHLNVKYGSDDWVEWRDRVQVGRQPPCHKPWLQAAIRFNGDIHLCCRDSLREHPVGNLRTVTLGEAFNGPVAQALRTAMETGHRRRLAMCRTCALHDRTPFEARPSAAPPPSGHLPWGRYDYPSARALARQLGHLALPGALPLRYEYVVGLTPALARAIVRTLVDSLGASLLAVWVCGNRVVTRARLRELDPAVFAGRGGTLELAGKGSLREFGPDPRHSSDLDLKVLVDERRVGVRAAERRGQELGRALEQLGAPMPLSGHRQPSLRLWRVPRLAPRPAFDAYNTRRREILGKGPHSLEQAVLLFAPGVELPDTAAEVRAELAPRGPRPVELARLPCRPVSLRARWGRLSVHQLIGALLDCPDLEPAGVRVVSGAGGLVVTAGVAAVWAAREAGREHLWLPSR